MDTQIIVALIAAAAVVIGAIITAITEIISSKKKGDEKRTTIAKDNTIIGDINGDNVMINSSINQIEPKKSILSFASHNVDPNYALNIETEEEEEGFSMINVRIMNKGGLDAAITKLRIIVKDYIIDREPHFSFPSYIKNGVLFIDVFNNGWGDSKNANFSILFFEGDYDIEDNELETTQCINKNEYFKEFNNKIAVQSDQRINLFKIKSEYLDYCDEEGIEISAIIKYQIGKQIKISKIFIEPEVLGVRNKIILFKNKFELYKKCSPCAPGFPDTIYATIIDENTELKEYRISRKIKSGGIDDFNIYVGSKKSCEFKIILSFIYNGNEVLVSDEIPIHINRYTDSKTYREYIDGCEIALKNFRKKNKIENLS